MKTALRVSGALMVFAALIGAYLLSRSDSLDESAATAMAAPLDPGYAARDAEVIETGYDGQERYRLKAELIRQLPDSGVIQLEQLQMNYRPGAQRTIAEEPPAEQSVTEENWQVTADRGEVQADGDQVLLNGNVRVIGPAPGGGLPLELATSTMKLSTRTEYLETDAPVTLTWSGHRLDAVGLKADLKAGTLRLESDVHGKFPAN